MSHDRRLDRIEFALWRIEWRQRLILIREAKLMADATQLNASVQRLRDKIGETAVTLHELADLVKAGGGQAELDAAATQINELADQLTAVETETDPTPDVTP